MRLLVLLDVGYNGAARHGRDRAPRVDRCVEEGAGVRDHLPDVAGRGGGGYGATTRDIAKGETVGFTIH